MAGERVGDWLVGDQSKSSGDGGGGGSEVNAASLLGGNYSRDRGGGGEVNAASLLGGNYSRDRGGGGGSDRMSAVDLTVGRRKSADKEDKVTSFLDGLFTRPADEIKKPPRQPRVRPDPTPKEPRVGIVARIRNRASKAEFTSVGDPTAFDQSKTGLPSRHSAVQNYAKNRLDNGRVISPAIRKARSDGVLPDQRGENQSPIDEPTRRFPGRRSGAIITGMAMLRMAAGVDQGSGDTDHSVHDASEMAGGPARVGFAETSDPFLVAEQPQALGTLTMRAVHVNMPPHDLAA